MVGDDIMTPDEAGVWLGGREHPVSLHTLANWRCTKRGPRFVKYGSLVRYRKVDLDNFMSEQTRGSEVTVSTKLRAVSRS